MRVYVEDWGADYGSPYLISPDQEPADTELVEDGPAFSSHAGARGQSPFLAFVDGVRRADAWLNTVDEETGEVTRGVAGSHGVGAVIVAADQRPTFADECASTRMAIWGSGQMIELPDMPGGFSWATGTTPREEPDAPLMELQNRMRHAEGKLAAELARQGMPVVLDGPLNFIDPLAYTTDLDDVAGYVKTHHRALLPPEHHRLIPRLEAGSRTSIFRLGDERYSCYSRIAETGIDGNPWSGIIRLEFPAAASLARAISVADRLAGELPRFAGIRHRDPRAPQNLQPVGALETHLRHLLGHPGLASRAVREAVASLSRR